MQPEKNLFIILLITSLLFQGSWSIAENHDEAASDKTIISTSPTVQESLLLTDSCDEAREWYDEGLLLSDNSNQEIYSYQRAIELCPGFVAAHNRLGYIYKNQGKYILSIREFEQARIQAFASNRFASRSGSKAIFLESVISLGDIYRIQGKYKLAEEVFSKALQMYPDSLAAQNNLQYVYKRMHRYDNALSPRTSSMFDNAIFTRIPGLTLPVNTFRLGFQYRFWDQTAALTPDLFEGEEINILTPIEESDLFTREINFLIAPTERKTNVRVAILSMQYGLTNDLTIGLIPTYFSRLLDSQLEGFEDLTLPRVKGIGDTELLLKYHIWGKRYKHLSIYTLFNLPTGRGETEVVAEEPLISLEQVNQEGVLVTRNVEFKRFTPLGSESYDITPGLAFSLGVDPIILHTNMQYRFTNGKLIGDEFRINCGAVYRTNPSVNATMEINYRWRGEARRREQIILNTLQPLFVGPGGAVEAGPVAAEVHFTEKGGHTLFLSPGIKLTVAQGIKVEFGMQIPVIRQADGWSEDIIYNLGITFMNF